MCDSVAKVVEIPLSDRAVGGLAFRLVTAESLGHEAVNGKVEMGCDGRPFESLPLMSLSAKLRRGGWPSVI